MSKQGIFNLVMTLLVCAGLFLAILYFFGDTHKPDGLRQKIFGAVPEEEPIKGQKATKETESDKEVAKEEKKDSAKPADKKDTTVVVVEEKTKEKPAEKKKLSELTRDEAIDRKLAEMSLKDLKNLRADTMEYLQLINDSEAGRGTTPGHGIGEFEKYVPLKDPVIKDLALPFAKALKASCQLNNLKEHPELAEEIGLPKCSKCKNQYVYDCPKCKKKEARTLSDHDDQGGFALKGLGNGKKTKAQKAAEARDRVCSMCGNSKYITCSTCTKRLANIVKKLQSPLKREVNVLLDKINAAYSIKKNGAKSNR